MTVHDNQLVQRIAVITGANAGLGFQISRALSQRGFRIILACRNPEKAETAIASLQSEFPDNQFDFAQLDVSDIDSVTAFPAKLAAITPVIDLLVNNAGVTAQPLKRTAKGHELQLATNFIGPFALTKHMLDFFVQERPGRIVNISSLAHRIVGSKVCDMNFDQGPYKKWLAYGQSKFALMAFTQDLQDRLRREGRNITVVAAHPGFAATDIMVNESLLNKFALGRKILDKMKLVIPSAESAARPAIFAACDDSIKGGEYIGPGGFLEIAGQPAPAKINKNVQDSALRQQIWRDAEVLAGLSY